ncbi:hypothetical protein BDW66DRAFT_140980, partial [Aspergillus desertorum]
MGRTDSGSWSCACDARSAPDRHVICEIFPWIKIYVCVGTLSMVLIAAGDHESQSECADLASYREREPRGRCAVTQGAKSAGGSRLYTESTSSARKFSGHCAVLQCGVRGLHTILKITSCTGRIKNLVHELLISSIEICGYGREACMGEGMEALRCSRLDPKVRLEVEFVGDAGSNDQLYIL